ncbi:type II toxin-antitoxin system VapC family toxin [Demetria terragena]|uniref:type II toxin-antitoxin system VapC family toxin n=1 Tax=Demetria terragena TaxID=63959 RepID=UPI000366332E|nr:type II toxin-antitoxin system VapC family toxin [Demetria terragena]
MVIVVDTSALIAILRGEPEADQFEEVLASASVVHLSAASKVELDLVAGRNSWPRAHDLLSTLSIRTAPFDDRQSEAARIAHARFGRGSGSPARLNLGDCFSYALAITRDEALLFKGDDFTHTDVRPAR